MGLKKLKKYERYKEYCLSVAYDSKRSGRSHDADVAIEHLQELINRYRRLVHREVDKIKSNDLDILKRRFYLQDMRDDGHFFDDADIFDVFELGFEGDFFEQVLKLKVGEHLKKGVCSVPDHYDFHRTR